MSDTITDLVKSVTYDAGRHYGSGENERYTVKKTMMFDLEY